MEILWRSHNARVTELVRGKAEQTIAKLARRLKRAVDAHIVFEHDGPTRRVEIVLHAPRRRNLVAEGRASHYAVALDLALEHLASQTNHAKRPAKSRRRRAAKA